jgi:L-arabinose isomerase
VTLARALALAVGIGVVLIILQRPLGWLGFALIDASTNLNTFKQELQWNDAYYLLRRGLA